jgi:hypothetical protein
MLDNYAKSDFSIMPYDFETYKLRGSAVFMESLMYGRTFALSGKTGFEPLMDMFPSGTSCVSDIAFCHAIHEAVVTPPEILRERCSVSRDAYSTFSQAALDNVFK